MNLTEMITTFASCAYVGASHANDINNPAGIEALLGFGPTLYTAIKYHGELQKQTPQIEEKIKSKREQYKNEEKQKQQNVNKTDANMSIIGEYTSLLNNANTYMNYLHSERNIDDIRDSFEKNYMVYAKNKDALTKEQQDVCETTIQPILNHPSRKKYLQNYLAQKIKETSTVLEKEQISTFTKRIYANNISNIQACLEHNKPYLDTEKITEFDLDLLLLQNSTTKTKKKKRYKNSKQQTKKVINLTTALVSIKAGIISGAGYGVGYVVGSLTR